ncbi:MAG: hypothetical protein WCC39_16125 [Telluria sp.]
MNKKLDKEQLLRLLDRLAPSALSPLSDAAFEETINAFCAGCPDPVRARSLLLDCLDPLTDAELVERALAMPAPQTAAKPARSVPRMPLKMPAYL